MENLRIFWLAVKYWLQGDEWTFAVEYATSLVKGWKTVEKKDSKDS